MILSSVLRFFFRVVLKKCFNKWVLLSCIIVLFLLHALVAKPGPDDAAALQAAASQHDDSEQNPTGSFSERSTIVVAGSWRAPPPHEENGDKNTASSSLFSSLSWLPPLYVPMLPPAGADGSFVSEIPTLTRNFRLRLIRAVEIALQHRIPRIVFTGGKGDALVSRAFVMQEFAAATYKSDFSQEQLENDVAIFNISVPLTLNRNNNNNNHDATAPFVVSLLIESQSTTTEENAKFAVELLMKNQSSEVDRCRTNLVAVSTPGHLRRCRIYFTREMRKFCNTSSSPRNIFMVGSDRNTLQFHPPRGFVVPPSTMGQHNRDRCFYQVDADHIAAVSDRIGRWGFLTPLSPVLVPAVAHIIAPMPLRYKAVRFIQLLFGEEPVGLYACAALHSQRHWGYRIIPSIWSIPFMFELRELGALVVNMLQKKITLKEVREFHH